MRYRIRNSQTRRKPHHPRFDAPHPSVSPPASLASGWLTNQIFVPDVNLDTVLLMPREAFLRHGRMPTFEEARVRCLPFDFTACRRRGLAWVCSVASHVLELHSFTALHGIST